MTNGDRVRQTGHDALSPAAVLRQDRMQSRHSAWSQLTRRPKSLFADTGFSRQMAHTAAVEPCASAADWGASSGRGRATAGTPRPGPGARTSTPWEGRSGPSLGRVGAGACAKGHRSPRAHAPLAKNLHGVVDCTRPPCRTRSWEKRHAVPRVHWPIWKKRQGTPLATGPSAMLVSWPGHWPGRACRTRKVGPSLPPPTPPRRAHPCTRGQSSHSPKPAA